MHRQNKLQVPEGIGMVFQNYTFVLFSIILLAVSGSRANTVYKAFCEMNQANKNQLKIYENYNGDYAINLQMFETYKHFRACKNKDLNLKIDSTYDSALKNLEIEFQHQQNLKLEEIAELNHKSFEAFTEAQSLLERYFNELIAKTSEPMRKNILIQIKNRVATVRLNKARYCNAFNANYNFVSHSVDTCTEILSLPKTTLVAIYAHELTHSIDPCSLQFSFFKIKDENPFWREQLTEKSVPLDAYTALPKDWATEDLILEEQQIETAMQPLLYALNPYQKVLECIQSKQSVNAQKRRNPIEQPLVVDNEQMCSSTLQDGQMAEGFADWMAYEVLAYAFDKAKEEDLKEKVFETVLNITSNECSQTESAVEIAMRTAVMASEKCQDENKTFFMRQKNLRDQTLVDTHPSGLRRVDRLFAVQPIIRKLLLKYYFPKEFITDDGIYCGK
ncbi:MAG: hypothetical protein ACXVCP_08230 [Bdellovibrio sp.]